jgi:hypothetical protein
MRVPEAGMGFRFIIWKSVSFWLLDLSLPLVTVAH